MYRELLIDQIYDLHAELKKGEFSELLTSRVQLEGHLAKQSVETLETTKRLFENLLEIDN